MIVVSPTDRWFRSALLQCSSSLHVASPFVGKYLSERIESLPLGIPTILLTRTLLTDFASSASDLDAVCSIARRTGHIFSLNSLHAKVYVIDKARALITSANATFSGMFRN